MFFPNRGTFLTLKCRVSRQILSKLNQDNNYFLLNIIFISRQIQLQPRTFPQNQDYNRNLGCSDWTNEKSCLSFQCGIWGGRKLIFKYYQNRWFLCLLQKYWVFYGLWKLGIPYKAYKDLLLSYKIISQPSNNSISNTVHKILSAVNSQMYKRALLPD